jgi:hypothetical protein
VTAVVARAIVPLVVIVPPVNPEPAVIAVTVPELVPELMPNQDEPFQIFNAEEVLSNQNSPGELPQYPVAHELGAMALTLAAPTTFRHPQLFL